MLPTLRFLPLICPALVLACGGEGEPPRQGKESFSAGASTSSSCEEAEASSGFSLLENFESGIASQFFTNNDGTGQEVNPLGG